MGKRFVAFCERYAEHFQLKTRQIGPQAQQYLSGLMQAGRKNMERMAEVVPDSDEQALQPALTHVSTRYLKTTTYGSYEKISSR